MRIAVYHKFICEVLSNRLHKKVTKQSHVYEVLHPLRIGFGHYITPLSGLSIAQIDTQIDIKKLGGIHEKHILPLIHSFYFEPLGV
jgi:hypothetical protein